MALPTAPLGQLPSMNMPYSVPTYEVGPSVWEKALAAFLVNAAGGAAQRGVSNVMSQDYAKEFGETPSSGFGRLLGPRVGEEDAIRRRTTVSQKDTQMRGIAADANMAKFKAVQDANRQATDIETEIQKQMMANDRLDMELNARAGLADKQTAADIRRDSLMTQLQAELQARDPGRLAQAEADRARARQSNAEAGWYERFANRGQGKAQNTPAVPQVAPEVSQFAAATEERLPRMDNWSPILQRMRDQVIPAESARPEVLFTPGGGTVPINYGDEAAISAPPPPFAVPTPNEEELLKIRQFLQTVLPAQQQL